MNAAPSFRDAALAYAARGYHVFPLGPRSKIPIEGSRGFVDATRDAATIRKWWATTPDANIGIACAASGLVVIDEDVPGPEHKHDGRPTRAALGDELGPLPETCEAITGTGGRHLVFQAPAGIEFCGSLGPGLDVKYNGYIVVAPSVRPEGEYRWRVSPLDKMPAPLPAAWLTRMAKPAIPKAATERTAPPRSTMGCTPYGRTAVDAELERVGAAPKGTRNNSLNEAALKLGSLCAGGEIPDVRDDLVLAAMYAGLPEAEARKTVESGWRAGTKTPRTAAPSKGRPATKLASPAPVIDLVSAATWPEPEPLPSGLPPVPAFDDHLLPEAFRAWLVDAAERVQCPPEYCATAVMVAAGAMVGRQCAIRPKRQDDWVVVPNVWGLVIGPPSTMKSPAVSEALRFVRRIEAEAAEQYARACENREAREALAETRKNTVKKKMAAAIKAGQETSLLVDEFTDAASSSEVKERRYSINDGTVEKVGELLIENPNGLLVNRDEMSGWFASLDRDGHENDRAFYLESWNGTHGYTTDRIARGTQHIPALCLSIFGGIQPGPLAQYQSAALRNGAGNDGLMQRFQMTVFPDPPRDWRNIDRWPDSEARTRAFEVFKRLANLSTSVVGAAVEEGELPFLRFDDAGQDFSDTWRGDLMARLRAGDDHAAIEAHLTKYTKLMPALALICHLADIGQGPVGLASAQRAAAWCDLLEGHARRIYASVTGAELRAANLLLAKLKSGKLPSPFTAHDVYHAAWSGLADRATVEAALLTLVEYGWVRSTTTDTGGRPRREYHVTPLLAVPAVSLPRDSQVPAHPHARRILEGR
jgi:hypothetical protein